MEALLITIAILLGFMCIFLGWSFKEISNQLFAIRELLDKIYRL